MLRKRRRDGRIRKQRSSPSSSSSVIDSALLELRFVIRSYDEIRIKKSLLSIYGSVKTLVRNETRRTNPPSRIPLLFFKHDVALLRAYSALLGAADRSIISRQQQFRSWRLYRTIPNEWRMLGIRTALFSHIAFNAQRFFYTYFMYRGK